MIRTVGARVPAWKNPA